MKTVKIGKLTLGNGCPKIAVSLTGKSATELLQQAQAVMKTQPDLVEWRLDYLQDLSSIKQLAGKLRLILKVPLLLTFRTQEEGGVQPLGEKQYFGLLRKIIDQQLADALDIEVARNHQQVETLVQVAHQHKLPVILSYHDFQQTPTTAQILNHLKLMNEMQADLAKIAVMPHTAYDVLELLTATRKAADQLPLPVITMAMGSLGKITRLSGELFGSVLTFGSVGTSSAPGQISVARLRTILAELQLQL